MAGTEGDLDNNSKSDEPTKLLTRREFERLYAHISGPKGLDRRKPHATIHKNVNRLAKGFPFQDIIVPALFHYVTRYISGEPAANDLETRIFRNLKKVRKEDLEFAQTLLAAVRELPQDKRQVIFRDEYLDVETSDVLDTQELLREMIDEVERVTLARTTRSTAGFSNTTPPKPGRARYLTQTLQNVDGVTTDVLLPPHPWICSINGCRGADHVPALTFRDLAPNEIQWEVKEHEFDKEEASPAADEFIDVTFVPKRQIRYSYLGKKFERVPDCEEIEGVCLQVPEGMIGSEVVLTGFNFFARRPTVNLWDARDPRRRWSVTGYALGDREEGKSECDCTAKDQIYFRLPADMEPGVYEISVENPNTIDFVWAMDGFKPGSLTSNVRQIRLLPDQGTRYRIRVISIRCDQETPGCGSDELKISTVWSTGKRHESDKGIQKSVVKSGAGGVGAYFADVDDGDEFSTNIVLFSGDVQQWLSVGILGVEVDDSDYADKYMKSWTSVYFEVVGELWEELFEKLDDVCSGQQGSIEIEHKGKKVPVPVKWICYFLGGVVSFVVGVVGTIILIPWAIWAPSDLLIEDTITLNKIELNRLIDYWHPLPTPTKYKTPNGVTVSVNPKGRTKKAYIEERTYECSDGIYTLTYSYERLSAYVAPEVMVEALFGGTISKL